MESLGFTGTQEGVTPEQAQALVIAAKEASPREFHHGMCIGADHFMGQVLGHVGAIIHGHPPTNTSKMAKCLVDVMHAPKDYLARNRDIVLCSQALLAAPKGEETQRSGTWSTVRFARKLGRPVIICWPNGSTTRENV